MGLFRSPCHLVTLSSSAVWSTREAPMKTRNRESPPASRPGFLLPPRLLYWLNLALAAGLILLLALSPWLASSEPQPQGWDRLLAFFARDATVRRTAIASAIGLAVTGCVFFRSRPDKDPSPVHKGP